jgi:flagellar protein FlgJ
MDIQQPRNRYLNNASYASAALGLSGGLQGGASGRDSTDTGSFADVLEKAKMDRILNSVSRIRDQTETPKEAVQAGSGGSEPAAQKAWTDKARIDKTSKLYEQCEALETFLIKTLITGMRNTVQKTGLIDESFAGKMYEDMLYDEYAASFSKNTEFGMAELAYLELTGQRGKAISR